MHNADMIFIEELTYLHHYSVYAIDDGEVRIPGLYHPGYSRGTDGVVQVTV